MNNNSSPSPGLNVATRAQQGWTCWFHAIVDGLIMSAVSRKYLRSEIKKRGLNSNALNSGTCPRTIDGFWKYIAYRIKGSRSISPRIRNVNAIKASGLRRNKFANPLGFIPRKGDTMSVYKRRASASRSSVTAGTVSDMYNLYKQLFGNDFSYENKANKNNHPAFILVKGDSFPHYKIINRRSYSLSHVFISLIGVGGLWGHIISGFINSRSIFKLYDSNVPSIAVNWDWSKSNNKDLLDYINSRYGFPRFFNLRKVRKYAVYIRYDLI